MKPISTRITGTSAQLKPVKSARSCSPRSGKPSAATEIGLDDPGCPLALGVDVVRPTDAHGRVERVRTTGGRVGRTVRVDTEEESGAGPVRDPRARDVPDARAGRLRPRHDNPYSGTLEQRPETEAHTQVEVGLSEPAHNAACPAAVLDLPRGRAWADGLRLRVRAQVVPRIDHDDRALLRGRSGHE